MNGTLTQGLHVFTILDVNKDFILEITAEMPHVYRWFDFNGRATIFVLIEAIKQLKEKTHDSKVLLRSGLFSKRLDFLYE